MFLLKIIDVAYTLFAYSECEILIAKMQDQKQEAVNL